jgi:hypothetical protein
MRGEAITLAGAVRPRVDWAVAWRLLAQSDVRPVFMVLAKIVLAQSQQMAFVLRDHMIQHLAADGAHPSFRHTVLPGLRTLVRTALIPLPCKELADLDVEPAVTVEDHIAVRAWSWQCLPQLLQDRLAGGMRRDIEVENLTSLMLDDKSSRARGTLASES